MFLKSSTLISLRFFEAAARLLSFKQAALELHVTQGAVSQHIRNLESALSCKLFYRLPRQIALTADGERLAATVGRAFTDIERDAGAILARRPWSKVRLRVSPSFALRWLVPKLGDFYAHNSNIELSIVAAYGYIDPARRDFDIALELIKGPLPSFQCDLWMPEYLVPVCTPRYLDEHRFLRKPTDLKRATLLHDAQAWLSGDDDAEWRFWLDQVGATNVPSDVGQFFSLANLALEAALAHQGVAMGRASLIEDLLQSKQLITPLKDRVTSPVKHYLVYAREAADRPAVRTILQWLLDKGAGALSAK